jgi:hypothetical protein
VSIHARLVLPDSRFLAHRPPSSSSTRDRPGRLINPVSRISLTTYRRLAQHLQTLERSVYTQIARPSPNEINNYFPTWWTPTRLTERWEVPSICRPHTCLISIHTLQLARFDARYPDHPRRTRSCDIHPSDHNPQLQATISHSPRHLSPRRDDRYQITYCNSPPSHRRTQMVTAYLRAFERSDRPSEEHPRPQA